MHISVSCDWFFKKEYVIFFRKKQDAQWRWGIFRILGNVFAENEHFIEVAIVLYRRSTTPKILQL